MLTSIAWPTPFSRDKQGRRNGHGAAGAEKASLQWGCVTSIGKPQWEVYRPTDFACVVFCETVDDDSEFELSHFGLFALLRKPVGHGMGHAVLIMAVEGDQQFGRHAIYGSLEGGSLSDDRLRARAYA